MEKAAAQRIQAVLALMVGAFSFGIYTAHFESRMIAFETGRSDDASRVAGLIMDNFNIKDDAAESRDRITYLEAAIKNGGP